MAEGAVIISGRFHDFKGIISFQKSKLVQNKILYNTVLDITFKQYINTYPVFFSLGNQGWDITVEKLMELFCGTVVQMLDFGCMKAVPIMGR